MIDLSFVILPIGSQGIAYLISLGDPGESVKCQEDLTGVQWFVV